MPSSGLLAVRTDKTDGWVRFRWLGVESGHSAIGP